MTITTAKLSHVAGLSAAAAGLLLIVVQPVHPPDDVANVATTMWRVVHVMSMAMSVLGLVGVTGLYLRQVKQVGVLGLVGYALFASFYAIALALQFFEAFTLPSVATEAPRLAQSVLGVVSGAGGPIAVPAVQAVWTLVSIAYLVGGVLLGIAFFRGAVLSRGASALLAGGAVASLLVAVLPHAFERYAAAPVGVALVWLGISLWSQRPRTVTASAAQRRTTPVGVAAAE